MKGQLALLLLGGLLSTPLQASPDFERYVIGLKQEALAAGIKAETVAAAFADIRVIEPALFNAARTSWVNLAAKPAPKSAPKSASKAAAPKASKVSAKASEPKAGARSAAPRAVVAKERAPKVVAAAPRGRGVKNVEPVAKASARPATRAERRAARDRTC